MGTVIQFNNKKNNEEINVKKYIKKVSKYYPLTSDVVVLTILAKRMGFEVYYTDKESIKKLSEESIYGMLLRDKTIVVIDDYGSEYCRLAIAFEIGYYLITRDYIDEENETETHLLCKDKNNNIIEQAAFKFACNLLFTEQAYNINKKMIEQYIQNYKTEEVLEILCKKYLTPEHVIKNRLEIQ